MTFYAGGLAIVWVVLKKKLWEQAAAFTVVMLLIPAISYFAFPTFSNKVVNTRMEVSTVQEKTDKEGMLYSIAARVYSYKTALAVWEDNKLFGVGKPDLEGEITKRYAALYPEIDSKYYIQPHSQYLYNLAAYGELGLMAFLFGMFYPAWWARRRHAPLLFAQYVSIALSFFVEYALETQIGRAFVVFFLLLALQGFLPCEEKYNAWRPA